MTGRLITPTRPAGIAENGCSWTQCSVDDVAFSAALVQKVSANVCIDSDRVYAVGGSNGGMFVWDLGRDERSAEVFRAVAPILGLPHRGYLDPPVSESGMPVISITGSRDRTVPRGEWGQDTFTTTSDGDVYYYSSASAITKVWAEAHGCDATVPAEPLILAAPAWSAAVGLIARATHSGRRSWIAVAIWATSITSAPAGR
ncbi:MAG: hypothetical protein CM15mP103_06560 [Gammaproteobacteria bacterium]|nr:MAG: hypothetical protein CM15mP103_06560 [Gammaproteobacteria bacterium]